MLQTKISYYWCWLLSFHFLLVQLARFHQLCGKHYGRSNCSSFPVVPAFRSFQLSNRSSFPVVLTLQLFQLSGRSNSPVVPAFRSFQLSSRSNFPVVPALQFFQSFLLYGRTGRYYHSRSIRYSINIIGFHRVVYSLEHRLFIMLSTGKRKYVLFKMATKINYQHGQRPILIFCNLSIPHAHILIRQYLKYLGLSQWADMPFLFKIFCPVCFFYSRFHNSIYLHWDLNGICWNC